MLLNTWLTSLRRPFASRRSRQQSRRAERTSAQRAATILEALEPRTLLTALVVNADNVNAFLAGGTSLNITNSHLAGKDSLVIESISLSTTDANAIRIDLSGITLESIAIDSVNISNFGTTGIDIRLDAVSGLRTIAVEETSIDDAGLGLMIGLSNNTDVLGLTIDDSVISGVQIDASSGSDIGHGTIVENTIDGGLGIGGVTLNMDASNADNFQIRNNFRISSRTEDAILVTSTNAAQDGVVIANNQIGVVAAAAVNFRADGDTFVQPFLLSNNATAGETLQRFFLDVSVIGLEFDTDTVTGKPFTALGGSAATTGLQTINVADGGQTLELLFNDFQPGETLQFVIDLDRAVGIEEAIFGDDLIGAQVQIDFSQNKQVNGVMVDDINRPTASQFVVGAGVAGGSSGIAIVLDNSPFTNALVESNAVAGAPGHALAIRAENQSDVSGVIRGNEFLSSGDDGLSLRMSDSNFTGAIVDNNISGSGGHGIALYPVVTRSGIVERIFDSNPVIITSTNHGLLDGEEVIIQGIVNDDPTINHPANGRFTITRIDNNQFRLNGVDGTAAGVDEQGGGTWYVPNFQMDGSARGLVRFDLQSNVPKGSVEAATNAGPIVITSTGHGLTDGQRVRITNAAGNTAANGVFKITVLDMDRFSLDGSTGNGVYDTSAGLATWTANVVLDATNTSEIEILSPGHGLATNDEVRVTGVLGNTSANGTFRITVLDLDRFLLQGSAGNAFYAGGGNWVPIEDAAFGGDTILQQISGNSITANVKSGFFVDLPTGSELDADMVGNRVIQNGSVGIRITSHSFGLGTDLPLDPNDPLALPGLQDISFDVNIGTDARSDGNLIDGNVDAGIAIEAYDNGTGRFEIRNNTIVNTRDDAATSPLSGDGIHIRMDSDLLNAESTALLAESIIDSNIVGVDNQGNAGTALVFTIADRTRVQDFEVRNNDFINSREDGFRFVRTDDADLNKVIVEKNKVTNNLGDGFDFFASNTTEDRLDFRVAENDIDNNMEYGMRIDLVADTRIQVDFHQNSVTGNGAAGNGFHGNDGVSAGAAGGIGIRAFQQVDVIFNMNDNLVNNNIGDGFGVDAFNHNDTLKVTGEWNNNEFNRNSLTGFRNHGMSYGSLDIFETEFNFNGEDGVRSVSIDDKGDFFRRRVGGADIDLRVLASQFIGNIGNGMHLGQGVSAQIGDGSIPNANVFDNNGQDGLKITQGTGVYLVNRDRRRLIQTDRNFFRNNGGDGVDMGHYAATEGGNVEQGDEVFSDSHVVIANAQIKGNAGDGVEYLADNVHRIPEVTGGGQDIAFPGKSSLTVSNSSITNNGQRGIDILNRTGEDSFVKIYDNEIIGNKYSGIYVNNTASHNQLQSGPSDPLHLENEAFRGVSPQLEIRIQDNQIESNGSSILNGVPVTSTVTINSSQAGGDASATPNPDWTHDYAQVPGTLGGLVFRVGAVHSYSFHASFAESELGRAGIDAEVWKNSFDGNIGADVYADSYISVLPPHTGFNMDLGDNPNLGPSPVFYRDPQSRLDLVFRENTGNSLDVVNGFAFLDSSDSEHKSRVGGTGSAPDHIHNPNNPGGPHASPTRKRNATRTLGFANSVGDVPDSQVMPFVIYGYEGHGTPTWRVESDFDFNNFTQTDITQGFSHFFHQINLGNPFDFENWYQWDTGVNTPTFTGLTPYSLDRGDIFNVKATEDPIQGDQLEENDTFVSAYDLGALAGSNLSLNGLTTDGILNIDTKGDRDYYRFIAAGTGNVDLDLQVTDGMGDPLQIMLYEVQPDQTTEEVALLRNIDLTTAYITVPAGGSDTLTAPVVNGREYIIEILSQETSNLGFAFAGKPYVYGTSRAYVLNVDTTGVPPSFTGGGGGESSSFGNGNSNDGGSLESPTLPGPPTADIENVSPDPRSTSVATVHVNFNEDVTGVDIADFTLTRDGVDIDISGLVVTQVTPMEYTVPLGSVTGEPGSYTLKLTALGSGIRDTDNNLLTVDATDDWVTDGAVTSFIDAIDTNPGDGAFADVNGNATLRAAVMETNAIVGSDVLILGAGTYLFSLDGHFEDDSAFGDLDIKDNLTIRGVSPATTIINAASLDRVFHVFPGVSLVLENLTLINGQAHDGGGILNEGSLSLTNVNIIDSEAFNQGGGIYNQGSLTSVGSSISMNRSGSRGGGIHNRGTIDLLNTTVSGNRSVSRGAGVFNEGGADLVNVSMVDNVTGSRGGGFYAEVGFIPRVGNSLFDRNVADATHKDYFGSIISHGFNLVRQLASGVDATTSGFQLSDKFGRPATPLVIGTGPLTNLGGDGTWHNPLLDGGIAVDGGRNSLFPATGNLINEVDQIENPRLIDGDRNSTLVIDVGATEFFLSEPVAIFTATPNPAGVGETVSLNATASTHTDPSRKSIVLYEWDFEYDGATFTLDATGATTSTSYPTTGDHRVLLRVTDNSMPAQTDTYELVVSVGIPLQPVVVRPFPVTSDLTPPISWEMGSGRFNVRVTNLATSAVVISLTDYTQNTYTPPTNLPPGMYRVVVTGVNSSGSVESLPYDFEIRRTVVTGPTGNIFDVTPEFTWDAIPNTSRYDLWVNRKAPGHVSQILRNQTIPGNSTSFTSFTRLYQGDFSVWIRAVDDDDNVGDWSLSTSFTIVRPSLTSPARYTLDSTPTFTWTDVGAPFYELWVQRLGDGPRPIIHQLSVAGTSFTPASNLPNGDYRVWVRALEASGEEAVWSVPLDFSIVFKTGPVLISPMGITTDRTPIFRWEAIDYVTRYDLWVDNLTTGQKQVIRQQNLTTNSFEAQVPLDNSIYRWWVRAFSEDGFGTNWSTPKDFEVPIPRMTGPVAPITTRTPTLTWTGVDEYVTYQLWVDNLTTGVSQVILENNLPANPKSFTPPFPLENGLHRAWVRGVDAEGNLSQWSPPRDFDLSIAVQNAPILVRPGGTSTNRLPTFVWQPVANAFSYELIVRRITNLGQPIVLDVRGIDPTVTAGTVSFTPPAVLAGGRYRWWVRAVNAINEPGPYSSPKEFLLVSSETERPETGEAFGPDESVPSFIVDSEPILASFLPGSLHSVTVHPAAVIARVIDKPVITAADVVATEATLTVSDADASDAVMTSWTGLDWWDGDASDVSADSGNQADVEDHSMPADLLPEETVAPVPLESRGLSRMTEVAAALIPLGLLRLRKRRKQDSE